MLHRNVGKYDGRASKDVYKIVTGDSWIYAYELATKQWSTVWVFEPEPYPTKVVRGRSSSKQMVAYIAGRSILSETPHFVCLQSLEKYNGIALKDVYKILTGYKS